MPSKGLIEWHQKNCPDVDINSIEFTMQLLEELTQLKEEKNGRK
jgi:hypothetical protein